MNWVKKAADKIRKNRSSASFEKLCENISHIDAKFHATNRFTTYGIVPAYKRLTGKSCTYTVEHMNRIFRYYLARFSHKTYC